MTTTTPFWLPAIVVRDRYLRVVESGTSPTKAPRDPVTIYAADHPEIAPWLAILATAHREIVQYVARKEHEGEEFPR
jgi:hypothetical protein